jgi:hypothetical protein
MEYLLGSGGSPSDPDSQEKENMVRASGCGRLRNPAFQRPQFFMERTENQQPG